MRSTPDLAPLWVTRIMGAPSKGPPTTPSLARNSSTMPLLKSLKSMSLMGGDGIGVGRGSPTAVLGLVVTSTPRRARCPCSTSPRSAPAPTPRHALRASLDLVQEAERLGYHRYWVAEHHNMPGIASSAPAVLLAHLASVTDRIRLGSGGVMLPNHAPLVIAEQFGMLEALHPGRIDLGIGRAPGTDPRTAAALRRSIGGPAGARPPRRCSGELSGFFNGTFPDDHPYRGITAVPARGNQPGDLAARLERLQRPPGRPARPAVLLRPPLRGGQHAARPRRLPRSPSARPPCSTSPT